MAESVTPGSPRGGVGKGREDGEKSRKGCVPGPVTTQDNWGPCPLGVTYNVEHIPELTHLMVGK